MRRLGSALLALLLAGFLASTDTATAQPVVLDAENLRKLAFEALRAGFAEDALGMTDALLERDANDASALTIRAQALRALGQNEAAIAAARSAWASADTDAARFGAAMAMAAAQSSAGNRTRAELWLRRAAENAPNDRAYAIARRDFGYVQSRNPWRFVLDVNASPSSNVNNGSSQSSFALPGLPFIFEIEPANQALSGVELGFGVEAIYRLSPTGPNRQTSLTFGTSVKTVALSSGAKAAAPTVRNSDFTLASLEFGVQHRRGIGVSGDRILMLSGTFGHNWYGGENLSDYLQLSASLTQPLGAKATLTWGLDADRITRLDRRPQSSDRVAISATLGLAVGENGEDRLSVRLTGTDVSSDSSEVRNQAMGLNLSWEKADPIAGIGIAASLGLEQRAFGDSRYAAGGREDTMLSAKVELTFTQIDYLGFSPVLELQASQNRSNSDLHDSESFGVNLGIASTF